MAKNVSKSSIPVIINENDINHMYIIANSPFLSKTLAKRARIMACFKNVEILSIAPKRAQKPAPLK